MQKSVFPKMCHYVGFLQIRSHICSHSKYMIPSLFIAKDFHVDELFNACFLLFGH